MLKHSIFQKNVVIKNISIDNILTTVYVNNNFSYKIITFSALEKHAFSEVWKMNETHIRFFAPTEIATIFVFTKILLFPTCSRQTNPKMKKETYFLSKMYFFGNGAHCSTFYVLLLCEIFFERNNARVYFIFKLENTSICNKL